jgi:hypothetical protein
MEANTIVASEQALQEDSSAHAGLINELQAAELAYVGGGMGNVMFM